MNSSRATYLTVLFGSAAWCLAIIAAPFLAVSTGSYSAIAELVYRFFQPVCHQIPGRSFTLFGGTLAVCSRCSSIYFSFFVGVCVYPLLRSLQSPVMPPAVLLLAAAAPMLLEVLSGAIGLHDVTNATRAATGAVFGVVLPLFIVPAAIEAVCAMTPRRFPFLSTQQQKGLTDA